MFWFQRRRTMENNWLSHSWTGCPRKIVIHQNVLPPHPGGQEMCAVVRLAGLFVPTNNNKLQPRVGGGRHNTEEKKRNISGPGCTHYVCKDSRWMPFWTKTSFLRVFISLKSLKATSFLVGFGTGNILLCPPGPLNSKFSLYKYIFNSLIQSPVWIILQLSYLVLFRMMKVRFYIIWKDCIELSNTYLILFKYILFLIKCPEMFFFLFKNQIIIYFHFLKKSQLAFKHYCLWCEGRVASSLF